MPGVHFPGVLIQAAGARPPPLSQSGALGKEVSHMNRRYHKYQILAPICITMREGRTFTIRLNKFENDRMDKIAAAMGSSVGRCLKMAMMAVFFVENDVVQGHTKRLQDNRLHMQSLDALVKLKLLTQEVFTPELAEWIVSNAEGVKLAVPEDNVEWVLGALDDAADDADDL